MGKMVGGADGFEVADVVVLSVLVAVMDVHPGGQRAVDGLVERPVVELAAAVAVVAIRLVLVPPLPVPVDEFAHVAMLSPGTRSRIGTQPRVVQIGCSGVARRTPAECVRVAISVAIRLRLFSTRLKPLRVNTRSPARTCSMGTWPRSVVTSVPAGKHQIHSTERPRMPAGSSAERTWAMAPLGQRRSSLVGSYCGRSHGGEMVTTPLRPSIMRSRTSRGLAPISSPSRCRGPFFLTHSDPSRVFPLPRPADLK